MEIGTHINNLPFLSIGINCWRYAISALIQGVHKFKVHLDLGSMLLENMRFFLLKNSIYLFVGIRMWLFPTRPIHDPCINALEYANANIKCYGSKISCKPFQNDIKASYQIKVAKITCKLKIHQTKLFSFKTDCQCQIFATKYNIYFKTRQSRLFKTFFSKL